MTVGPDGSIYIADTWNDVIRRVDPAGIITTVAGTGTGGFSGDGGLAIDAQLNLPNDVAVGLDGSLYILDEGNNRVRRVSTDGIIQTIAGGGAGATGNGGPATAATIEDFATAIEVGPDGAVYIADDNNHQVRRVHPGESLLPNGNAFLIASEDGREAYVFDLEGKHKETRDTLTGALLYSFKYDEFGEGTELLTQVIQENDNDTIITPGVDNVTTIQRNGTTGAPEKIIGPFGQETLLGLDGNGFLSTITNPAMEQHQFNYTTDGLMTSMWTPKAVAAEPDGSPYVFHYDQLGRLIHDADPAGGGLTLERVDDGSAYTVTARTALNRETRYRIENLPSGDKRFVNTFPSGLSASVERQTNGTATTTFPDQSVTTTVSGPDPRFGMHAPIATSRSIDTPGGRHYGTTTQRTRELLDEFDLLSLGEQTDTVIVNGTRQFTTTFNAATLEGAPHTITRRSAECFPPAAPPFPLCRQVMSTLDDLGRILKTEALGTNLYPIRLEYDPTGRLLAIKHGPDVSPESLETRITSFNYKNTSDHQNGYLDTITDAVGRVVQFEYDAAGRVATQLFEPGSATDQRIVSYDYDPNGNLETIVPPGKPPHGFLYTPVDQEEYYAPPGIDGNPNPDTTFVYTPDRELDLILRPDSDNDVNFDYESTSGRLRSVTIPSVFEIGGDESSVYGYHPSTGNLETLTGPDASLTFSYDGPLLLSEQWSGALVNGTVTRTYNNDLQVETLQVGPQAVDFDYDLDGLLTKAGSLDPIDHTNGGLLESTTLGSVTETWTYSPFGEVESYTAMHGVNVLYSYAIPPQTDPEPGRDKLGRITKMIESIEGVESTYWYTYDAAGRLATGEDRFGLTPFYEYDDNGNRISGLTASDLLVAGTYDDQDRLVEYATMGGGLTTYDYTDNGDLKSKTNNEGTTEYTYDALGNLRKVVLPDGTPITYLVDGRNRRIGKKVDGILRQALLYKDQLNPVAELDGAGNMVSEFVYATRPNVPDYMVRYDDPSQGQMTTYRIISDHLGSPRLVVNVNTGEIVQRTDYDEFGVILSENVVPQFTPIPFGFAGGLIDRDTGLVRFGWRDYDPDTGRWTSKDPIRFVGGDTNLYGYVLNDPVNLSDPEGLAVVGWIVTLGRGCIRAVKPLFSDAAARQARQQGKNVLMRGGRHKAKAIEKGASGGQPVLRHSGHNLPGGAVGSPHFQTPGMRGHTFWGGVGAALGTLLDPFAADAIECQPGEQCLR